MAFYDLKFFYMIHIKRLIYLVKNKRLLLIKFRPEYIPILIFNKVWLKLKFSWVLTSIIRENNSIKFNNFTFFDLMLYLFYESNLNKNPYYNTSWISKIKYHEFISYTIVFIIKHNLEKNTF